MELVFEPDLSNGEEAAALVKELCLILTRLGTCSCRMEEGALRVDANISIHQAGQPFGTRTEVKNIGSVRGVADAIGYEIRRQIELVDGGGVVHNETRSWDAQHKCTVAMRDKEVLQDYRFMPEPNLPPLHLHVGEGEPEGMVCVEKIRNEMPELPEQTRTKLSDEFALGWDVAVILMVSGSSSVFGLACYLIRILSENRMSRHCSSTFTKSDDTTQTLRTNSSSTCWLTISWCCVTRTRSTWTHGRSTGLAITQ